MALPFSDLIRCWQMTAFCSQSAMVFRECRLHTLIHSSLPTKDDIRVRMSAIDEAVWPSPALKKKSPPDFTKAIPISDFTKSGAMGLPEIVGPIYDEINKKYGTNYKPGFKE